MRVRQRMVDLRLELGKPLRAQCNTWPVVYPVLPQDSSSRFSGLEARHSRASSLRSLTI